jgi:hypothetical protein
MEKLIYVRFLPSGHYGAPEPTITDKKCKPFSYGRVLKAYKSASCTSWSMGDRENDALGSMYSEYGDFGCFDSVYVFAKNYDDLAIDIEILMEDFQGGMWDECREKSEYDDYAGYLFSKEMRDNYLFSYDDRITAYSDSLDEIKFKLKLPGTPSKKKPKNELYDLLDCVAESDIKELAISLIGNINLDVTDYLRDRRGFNGEDLEDLKLMSRMKKRSKYT